MLIIDKQPDRTCFSLNPILLKVRTTLPPSTINLKIKIEIYYEVFPATGSYILLGEFIKIPDSTGTVLFNLGEITGPLHASFTEQLDLPIYPNVNFTDYTNFNNKQYRIYIFEISGPINSNTAAAQVSPKWVVRGGLPWQDWPSAGFWNNYMVNTKPFLTTLPQFRAVVRNQPMYLHFWCQQNSPQYTLRCRVWWSDNTDSLVNKPFQFLLKDLIYKVPAGFDMLNLQSLQPAKTPVRYTLQVLRVNTPVSPIQTFYIDHKYHEYLRFFCYENSWGGVDTIYCCGTAEETFETELGSAERQPPFNDVWQQGLIYDPSQGQAMSYDQQQQESIKCNTGYKSLAEIKALADFFRSPFKYEWKDNQWVPIKIITKKVKQPKKGSTLFSQEFEYQYLFKNTAWAPSRIKTI